MQIRCIFGIGECSNTTGIALDTMAFYGEMIVLKRRKELLTGQLDALESEIYKVSLVDCSKHFKPNFLLDTWILREKKGFCRLHGLREVNLG